MGAEIPKERFTEADAAKFSARLRADLATLKALLADPRFGEGERTVGAELELFLIDAQGSAVLQNEEVLSAAHDPGLTVELDRFNLELNAPPVTLKNQPFTQLRADLLRLLTTAKEAAARHQVQMAMIGILPTLSEAQLGREALTDSKRYRALSAGITERRQAPLHIRIDGPEPLKLDWNEVTLQGANTSFQLHLRVAPADFAKVYNAAQIATAVALAVGANSPFFLGHQLWAETRIPLFEQSVDDRNATMPKVANRASFGRGWVRESAFELFQESVALHQPLLPAVQLAPSMVQLAELKLHQGTVWTWNRPIYDDKNGAHLRIEFRALPAGPTLEDMLANAALLLGLTLGLASELEWMLPALPFAQAEENFYEAARSGMGVQLWWPVQVAPSPQRRPVLEMIDELLPVALKGLTEAGVSHDDAHPLLDTIQARCQKQLTGSRWQVLRVQTLERQGLSRPEALRRMLADYTRQANTGRPVHQWEPSDQATAELMEAV